MNRGEVAFDDTPKAVFAHFEELEKMGLAAPQITYIMHALKERGFWWMRRQRQWRRQKESILAALAAANSPLLLRKGGEQDA